MRSLWALFATFAITSAHIEWKEGQSYTYNIQSKSTATLQRDDETGVWLKAQLVLYPRLQNEIWAELRNAEYQSMSPSNQDMGFRPLSLTREKFIIEMKNGLMRELRIAQKTPAWEISLIKSVVSQLQMDTKRENLTPSSLNTEINERQQVFKTMEDSIEGKCKTIYEIMEIQEFGNKQQQREIIKTKDFNKCQRLPVYQFGFFEKPNSNTFMPRSSVTRVLLDGKTLKTIVANSVITFHPEPWNSHKAKVFTQMNMTMDRTEPHSENLTPPQNPMIFETLVADLNSSHPENSLMSFMSLPRINEGKILPSHPDSVYFNQIRAVRKLIDEIAEQMLKPTDIPKENTLNRFSLLVDIVRTMSVKQLQQATKEFYSEQNKPKEYIMWMTLRDVVSQAGTHSALTTIRSWIKDKYVAGEEAAQLIAALPDTVMLPSPEYVDAFYEMMKSSEVTSNPTIRRSAVFAFSKVLEMVQIDRETAEARYPVYVFGPIIAQNDQAITEKYIPYFAQQLLDSVNSRDSIKIQLYIRALGNVAHPNILRVFEPYLEGKLSLTSFQRTLMVVSLDKMSEFYPRVARSVLFKIYEDKNEAYQVRMAAIFNLMKTSPPASMLQRMAEESRMEKNSHVRLAVKFSIESATYSMDLKMRENAQAAVHMLPTEPTELFVEQNSRSQFISYLMDGLSEGLGLDTELYYSGSQDLKIPQIDAMVSSFLEIFDVIGSAHLSLKQPDPKHQSLQEDIERILRFKPQWRQQFEGNLLLNSALMSRFIPFTNHTLTNSISDLQQAIITLLKTGQRLNYQKFYKSDEMVMAFPTILGYPLIYTWRRPTILSFSGEAKLSSTSFDTKLKSDSSMEISTDIQAVYSSRSQAKISLVMPFEETQYIAGIDRNVHILAPVKIKLNVNTAKSSAQIVLNAIDSKAPPQRLLHLSSWPYLRKQAISTLEEPITRFIVPKDEVRMEETMFEQFGLPLTFKVKANQRLWDYKTIYDLFTKGDMTLLTEPLERNVFDIYLDCKKTSTIALKVTHSQKILTQRQGKWSDSEKNKGYATHEEADSESRRQEFISRTQEGLLNPIAHVIDVSLTNSAEESPTTLISTIGWATNEDKSNLHLLGFWSKQNKNTNPEKGALELNLVSHKVPVIGYHDPKGMSPIMEMSGKLNYGEAQISANGFFDRSENRLKYLMNQPVNKVTTLHAGLLDRYRVQIKFQNWSDMAKNLMYQIYSVYRHLGFTNMQENIWKRSSEQSAELLVQYSPDLKRMDVSLETPVGRSELRNVGVNRYERDLAVLHPTLGLAERMGMQAIQESPVCTLTNSHVITLENATIPINFGNTWHVVMMSTPRLVDDATYDNNMRFTILSRNSDNNTFALKATFVNYENVVISFEPETRNIASCVRINSEQIMLKQKETYNYVSNGIRYFEITLDGEEITLDTLDYGVKIIYYFKKVIIDPSYLYYTRLGGICGSLPEEGYLITPQNTYLNDVEDFVASWSLANKSEIKSLQRRYEPANVVSDQDAGRANMMGQPDKRDYDDSSSSSESNESRISVKSQLHKKLMAIEHEGSHCFSINLQPSCKQPSQVQKTEAKLVKFVCVEKNENSQRWAKLIEKGARPDFSRKGHAQGIQVQVPIACSP